MLFQDNGFSSIGFIELIIHTVWWFSADLNIGHLIFTYLLTNALARLWPFGGFSFFLRVAWALVGQNSQGSIDCRVSCDWRNRWLFARVPLPRRRWRERRRIRLELTGKSLKKIKKIQNDKIKTKTQDRFSNYYHSSTLGLV